MAWSEVLLLVVLAVAAAGAEDVSSSADYHYEGEDWEDIKDRHYGVGAYPLYYNYPYYSNRRQVDFNDPVRSHC